MKKKYILLVSLLMWVASLGYAQHSRSVTYTYGGSIQLKKVEHSNGTTVEYGYDATGNLLYEKIYMAAKITVVAQYLSHALRLELYNCGGDPINRIKVTDTEGNVVFENTNFLGVQQDIPHELFPSDKEEFLLTAYTKDSEHTVFFLHSENKQIFVDIPVTHSYFLQTKFLFDNGLMKGYNFVFAPEDNTLRHQAVLVVFRYMKLPVEYSGVDVPEDLANHEYKEEFLTLMKQGIFKYSFPDQALTWGEACVVLGRVFGLVPKSDWATEPAETYIRLVEKEGWLRGRKGADFPEGDPISRQIFADAFYKAVYSVRLAGHIGSGAIPCDFNLTATDCKNELIQGESVVLTATPFCKNGRTEGEIVAPVATVTGGTIKELSEGVFEFTAGIHPSGFAVVNIFYQNGDEHLTKMLFFRVPTEETPEEEGQNQNDTIPIVHLSDFANLQAAIDYGHSLSVDRVKIVIPKGTYAGDLILYDGIFLMTEDGCDAAEYILKGKITYSGTKPAGVVGFTIDTDQNTAFDIQSGRFLIHKCVIIDNSVGIQKAEIAQLTLRNNDLTDNVSALEVQGGKANLIANIFSRNASDLELVAVSELRIAHNLLSPSSNITVGTENIIGEPSEELIKNRGSRDGYKNEDGSRNTIGYTGSSCSVWERDWLYGDGSGNGSWNVVTIYARDFASFQKAVNYARVYADSLGLDYVILSTHAGVFHPEPDASYIYVPDGVRIIGGYYEEGDNKFCDQQTIIDAEGKDFGFYFAAGDKGSQLINFTVRNAGKAAVFSENNNFLIYNSLVENSENGILQVGENKVTIANNTFENIAKTALVLPGIKGKVFNNKIVGSAESFSGENSAEVEFNDSDSSPESKGHFAYQNREGGRSGIGINEGFCLYPKNRNGKKPKTPYELSLSFIDGKAKLEWKYDGVDEDEITYFKLYNSNGWEFGQTQGNTNSFILGVLPKDFEFDFLVSAVNLHEMEGDKSEPLTEYTPYEDLALNQDIRLNANMFNGTYMLKKGAEFKLSGSGSNNFSGVAIDSLLWKTHGTTLYAETVERILEVGGFNVEKYFQVPENLNVGQTYFLTFKVMPLEVRDTNPENNEVTLRVLILSEKETLKVAPNPAGQGDQVEVIPEGFTYNSPSVSVYSEKGGAANWTFKYENDRLYLLIPQNTIPGAYIITVSQKNEGTEELIKSGTKIIVK